MNRLICLLFCLCFPLFGAIELPKAFDKIVEQLIFHKGDHFKVFYGGPVENSKGCTWVMAASFEDDEGKISAVYEVLFCHCSADSKNIKNASIYFTNVSDIDIRLKNTLSKEFNAYICALEESSPQKPKIIIREADISNLFYPEIFISQVYSDLTHEKRQRVVAFVRSQFGVEGEMVGFDKPAAGKTLRPSGQSGILNICAVAKDVRGKKCEFEICHYYLPDQPWKSYYLIYKRGAGMSMFGGDKSVTVRLDSGCTSGQIYEDDACDCLDQLDIALADISSSSEECGLVIHMPTQDGRGFGFAPKAETEIYKRGGKGRIHTTAALDTIQAAMLLYNTDQIDIRSYEGCGQILAKNGVRNVKLLTDNQLKIDALRNEGIHVEQKTAFTGKLSCLKHIKAKNLFYGKLSK